MIWRVGTNFSCYILDTFNFYSERTVWLGLLVMERGLGGRVKPGMKRDGLDG